MPKRPQKTSPQTPGISWMPDRKRLYRFTTDTITVIEPWPRALCWEKYTTWKGASTHMRLDYLALGSRAPYPYRFESEAWNTIPEPVRARVLQASLAGLQWNSLRLQARCPAASPLIDELPLLAAAAANLGPIRRHQLRSPPRKPWRDLRRALSAPKSRQRWARVARLLHWPQSPSFFKVLRRAGPLAPEQWSLSDVAFLDQVWAVPWLRKVLQHGPPLISGRLSALVAALDIARIGGRLPARLFLEIADNHTGRNVAGAIQAYVQLASTRAPETGPDPAALGSLEALEQATERLTALDHAERPFPPPPLEGTAELVPLASADALAEEGTAMNHCIGLGGFARRARSKQGFAYSLRHAATGARVATAWITPSAQSPGAFYIEQLQGPGNTDVSSPDRQRVERWLLRHAQAQALRLDGQSHAADQLAPPLHADWAPAPGTDASAWRWALMRRRPFERPAGPRILHTHDLAGQPLAEPFYEDEIPF